MRFQTNCGVWVCVNFREVGLCNRPNLLTRAIDINSYLAYHFTRDSLTLKGDWIFTFMLYSELPPEPEFEREILGWNDVDKLIDHLIPQFNGEFDGILMITNGGLIPGGILSEAMDIKHVLTASVYIPSTVDRKLAWPTFMQFPPDTLLSGRRILVVNDIWANGRVIMIVKGRLAAVGCEAETAVLHYRMKSNLFHDTGPDYYGAITDRQIVYPWESSMFLQGPLSPSRGPGRYPAI